MAAPESALLNIRNLGPEVAGLLPPEPEWGDAHDSVVSDLHGMTTNQLVKLWASSVSELQRRGMLTTCTCPSLSSSGEPPET